MMMLCYNVLGTLYANMLSANLVITFRETLGERSLFGGKLMNIQGVGLGFSSVGSGDLCNNQSTPAGLVQIFRVPSEW